MVDLRFKGYKQSQPALGGAEALRLVEGGQSMGIVWTILAIIGLIVVLQFIF
jgi:hypothetical protein